MPGSRVGWQPSRFLVDLAEAERAFRLAERLGSVNAAAAELGTTWPSLRKAFARHGLGMPAATPKPSASAPSRPPASARVSRSRRALTRCLWRSTTASFPSGRSRVGSWPSGVRCAEDYAVLGARVVVELHTESHAAKPSTRAWVITPPRRPRHRLARQRASRAQRRQAERISRTDRPHQPQEREMVADAR